VIQIAPGDLVAVESEGRYYYALLLDRIKLFGGNWTFVFHASSNTLLTAEDLLAGPRQGYHAFVDFIWAKREKRLNRLARWVDTKPFEGPGRLKGSSAINEKATFWLIYDMNGTQLKRSSCLTPEEAAFPDYSRIDDTLMIDLVKRRWVPERDERL
jgi:hypothetical protein